MDAHGVFGEEQLTGDVVVVEPRGDPECHIDLARGEAEKPAHGDGQKSPTDLTQFPGRGAADGKVAVAEGIRDDLFEPVRREVVIGLIARGARVAAVDLNEVGLAETVQLAKATGGKLTTHVLNISDREAVLALPAAVINSHGQVDGLLNVAGIIQRFVKLVELDFADIERVMNVNFWGVVNMTKAFLPDLLARPESAVLNVSSMGGFLPVPGQAAYGASKAADAGKAYKTTSPADAGRMIIEGVEKGAYRVIIGGDAKFMDRMSRLSPRRATELIAKQMKALLG